MDNGIQCTVGWFVDDNKTFHVDDIFNITIMDIIEKKFEKLAGITCKKHTFWGMDIELLVNRKIDDHNTATY